MVNEQNYTKLNRVIQEANPEIIDYAKYETVAVLAAVYKGGIRNQKLHSFWRDASTTPCGISKKHLADGFENEIPTCQKCLRKDIRFNGQGRSIRLADVLLAVKNVDNSFAIGVYGKFGNFDRIDSGTIEVGWDLRNDNLDNQSDNCKLFLINLLVKQ